MLPHTDSLTRQETFAQGPCICSWCLWFLTRSIKLSASGGGKLELTSVTGVHPTDAVKCFIYSLPKYFVSHFLKSLWNENNRSFNAATVQPCMCICQSLLCFWFGLYPCICSQLFWRSSGFSVNPFTTHRLIRVYLRIMLFQGLNRVVKNSTESSPVHV